MQAETKHLAATTPVAFPAAALLSSYAATLFLSAGLVFLVQPMITKMVLPQLGGSPSVWNTCMCFFQASLLLGYGYAHVLATRFDERSQVVIHAIVLTAAAVFLPLDLAGATPPAEGSPAFWLIARLGVSVGPPFFAVSATAPLLQRWFSQSDHRAAGDPYFLYAASNAGSLIALVAYPLLVEPNLSLWQQSHGWSAGFALLAAGIIACWRGHRSRAIAAAPVAEHTACPALIDQLRWIACAFVPSSLLLAVTNHITTDIASAPLLWVIPLALYLLTFILAFARRPLLPHDLVVRLQPLLIIPLVVIAAAIHSIWPLFLHLAAFFITALLCHGELALGRPPVRDLTRFYLLVSLGGVLGGIFNAVIAPALFPDIWEYPLMLVAACLIRPAAAGGGRVALWGDLAFPGLLLAGLAVLFGAAGAPAWLGAAGLALAGIALLQFSARRLRFALGVAACLLVEHVAASEDVQATARSFFGVYHVRLIDGGAVRVLQHGTTIHGAESTQPGSETVPMSYYGRTGPFGRFFAAIPRRPAGQIGIVGLGTGVLGCYARPGEEWTFHEIDPEVAKLAGDPSLFQFLGKCGNHPKIVLGDARLTLQGVADGHYDVLVIDAFTSDSIPLHLLTRAALALYRAKLAPDGVVLFHISNRYLDLAPVVAALAEDAGMPARHTLYVPPEPSSIAQVGTEVMAVGQPGHDLDFLDAAAGWETPGPAPRSALWTDQRSDIVSRLKW
jgi:hypothetical protein